MAVFCDTLLGEPGASALGLSDASSGRGDFSASRPLFAFCALRNGFLGAAVADRLELVPSIGLALRLAELCRTPMPFDDGTAKC